jgi:hypothetical protein
VGRTMKRRPFRPPTKVEMETEEHPANGSLAQHPG